MRNKQKTNEEKVTLNPDGLVQFPKNIKRALKWFHKVETYPKPEHLYLEENPMERPMVLDGLYDILITWDEKGMNEEFHKVALILLLLNNMSPGKKEYRETIFLIKQLKDFFLTI